MPPEADSAAAAVVVAATVVAAAAVVIAAAATAAAIAAAAEEYDNENDEPEGTVTIIVAEHSCTLSPCFEILSTALPARKAWSSLLLFVSDVRFHTVRAIICSGGAGCY